MATREQLGMEPGQRLVLVSRGGNPKDFTFLPKLKNHPETVFLFAGGVREIRRESNLLFIPYQTEFFHPDLVHAADLVVGKAGYSMIAEIWASGTPFVYVLREGFRESPRLDLFLKEHISSQRITDQEFKAGRWVEDLDVLLALPRREPRINGATEAAHIILS